MFLNRGIRRYGGTLSVQEIKDAIALEGGINGDEEEKRKPLETWGDGRVNNTL